jgi:hypothetical protein
MNRLVSLPLLAPMLLFPLMRGANGPEWKFELVDQSGPAKSNTIKVDANGNLHVAYIADDGNRYPVKYAFWDRKINKWFVMQVAESAATCSLTLDSKQRPHIAYVDFGSMSGCGLKYVRWDGAAWQKQAIPLNSDIIAYFTSITLDPNDRPSISFYEYRGPKDSDIHIRMRHVMLAGKQWQVRTVDPEEGSGKFNCIAADSTGTLHLAYANVSANTAGLRYATYKGDGWRGEFVDTQERNNGQSVGFSTCLAVDKDNNPHLTYSNQTKPQMRYAVRRNNQWRIQVVDNLTGVGYPDRNSIALDGSNIPYISYHDAGRGELRLAYPAGKEWIVEVVDDGGFTSSVAVDKDEIYLAYGDSVRSGLKVARRPLSAGRAARQP